MTLLNQFGVGCPSETMVGLGWLGRARDAECVSETMQRVAPT